MKIAIFHELHAGGARRAVNEFAIRLKKKNRVDLFLVDEKTSAEENIFFSTLELDNACCSPKVSKYPQRVNFIQERKRKNKKQHSCALLRSIK